MTKGTQRNAAVLVAIWMLVLATACDVAKPAPSVTSTGTATPSGKLTVMVPNFGSERMDSPLAGTQDGTQNYARLIHGFLISHNEKRELIPGIASAWNLSADGLTWTFTIRKGVKFHNGSELTPEDVLWSLQHSIGPDALAWNASVNQLSAVSRNVDKIQIVPPDKVTLTTKQPDLALANFLSEAGPLWVAILPKRATLHDTQEEAAYDRNPIGAGPMKLVGHVNGVSMSFERFDDYYYQPKNGLSEDRRMRFLSLEMVAVAELSTRVAALRAGQADIVAASVATQSQVEAGGGRLVFSAEAVTEGGTLIGCWDKKFPCSDKRVRQALAYAVDKELIQNKLAGGPKAFELKGWPIVTLSTIGYSAGLDPRPFDPNKARQLLADAGYPGGKGFGKLIVNTFVSDVPFQVDSAQLAADSWKKELGLDVEVRVGEEVTVNNMQRAGQLDGQILWRQYKPRVDASSVLVAFFGNPQSTTMLHRDSELLKAVQEALGTLDPAKRLDAMKKLYVRLADEDYWFSVGYVNAAWGVGTRVAAWQPYPLTQWPSALETLTFK